MMNPDGAMRQAGMTAMEYLDVCFKYIDKAYPNINDEVKLQCASRMALAASIDFATAVFSGSVKGYPGVKVVARNENIDDFIK